MQEIKKTILEPLVDRVLVKPMEAESKTAGGIIIPDTAKETPSRGVVVAVGQGTSDRAIILSVGDVVLYGKYTGSEVEDPVTREKYVIMRDTEPFCRIREEVSND
jgi:chaperonin GroES